MKMSQEDMETLASMIGGYGHEVLRDFLCDKCPERPEPTTLSPKSIRLMHLESQLWTSLKPYHEDISRIALEGWSDDDEILIRRVCGYIAGRQRHPQD